MSLHQPRIEVSVATQSLRLFDGMRQVREWPCSTSKFGLGSQEGSNKTPLGSFIVKEKHGEGAESGTIFKSRQPVGLWTPGMDTNSDFVLTRILWLHGTQPHNANTYQRYIYIHGTNDEKAIGRPASHGTNDEKAIGRPASHGCVRMRNREVIELFDLVPVETPVWIGE